MGKSEILKGATPHNPNRSSPRVFIAVPILDGLNNVIEAYKENAVRIASDVFLESVPHLRDFEERNITMFQPGQPITAMFTRE